MGVSQYWIQVVNFLPWGYFRLFLRLKLLGVGESKGNFLFYPLASGEFAPISPPFDFEQHTCSSAQAFANSVFILWSFLRWRDFSSSCSISWSIFNTAACASRTAFLAAALALPTAEEVCDAIVAPDEGDGCERALWHTVFWMYFDWDHYSCGFNTSKPNF